MKGFCGGLGWLVILVGSRGLMCVGCGESVRLVFEGLAGNADLVR